MAFQRVDTAQKGTQSEGEVKAVIWDPKTGNDLETGRRHAHTVKANASRKESVFGVTSLSSIASRAVC